MMTTQDSNLTVTVRQPVTNDELRTLVNAALDALISQHDKGVEFTAYMVTLGLRSRFPNLEIPHFDQNGNVGVQNVVHEMMQYGDSQNMGLMHLVDTPYVTEDRVWANNGKLKNACTYIPVNANPMPVISAAVVHDVNTAPAVYFLASGDGIHWNN